MEQCKRCKGYIVSPFNEEFCCELCYTTSERYKLRRKIARTGILHSEETKKKISKSLTGRIHSEESKKKMSEAKIGTVVSEETRKKQSEARIGFKVSDETKRKISQSTTGRSKRFYDEFLFGKVEGHRTSRNCMNPDCKNEVSFEKTSKGYRKYCSGSCGAKITTKVRYDNLTDEQYNSWIKNKSEGQKRYWENMSPEDYKKRQETHSRAITKQILEGKLPTTFSHVKQGWHESTKSGRCFYRSSWELRAYICLDSNPLVKSYKPEPFGISYLDSEGVERGYYPDILVEYTDGSKELIEVKPECYLRDLKIQFKLRAGEIWSENAGIKFSVWTEVNRPELACVDFIKEISDPGSVLLWD
jgi:hypothetical protein